MGNSCEKLECIDFSVGPSAGRKKRRKAQFKGELTLHEHVFTGASGIDGEVFLTVTSPMVELKGVWIELVTLTCPPIKGDGACTLFDVRPNNPHVAIVGKVWPDYDDPEWPRDYTSGLYKFTFHFNLSQANLPATMDNDLGYIQHSLVLVSVSNHKWRILDSKQVINLSGSNNLAMFPYQLIPPSVRVRQRKSKRDTSRTTWQHGPLSSPSSTTTGMEVLMQLTKQGFLPNDTIEGCIKIENPVRAVVKEIRVQVKYQTTSRQSSPTHSKSCIIARDRIAITDDGGAGSSRLTQLETFSLKLPPEMDPSWVTNDSTMTNVYAVHFQVKTTDGIELRGAHSITIGTHDEPKNSAVPSSSTLVWARANSHT